MRRFRREISSSGNNYPETWRPLRFKNGRQSATIVCPRGHYGSLVDHLIRDDGRIEPSVVCHEDACDFHDDVQLLGWP